MNYCLAAETVLGIDERSALNAASLSPAKKIFHKRAVDGHQARLGQIAFMPDGVFKLAGFDCPGGVGIAKAIGNVRIEQGQGVSLIGRKLDEI